MTSDYIRHVRYPTQLGTSTVPMAYPPPLAVVPALSIDFIGDAASVPAVLTTSGVKTAQTANEQIQGPDDPAHDLASPHPASA